MDPQQTQQFGAAMAGFFGIIMIVAVAVVAFMIFLFWRILVKAGFAGPLALLLLIWPIGLVIVVCILAFGDWKVVPTPNKYAGLTPVYPPGAYPPAAPQQQNFPGNYPPNNPPSY